MRFVLEPGRRVSVHVARSGMVEAGRERFVVFCHSAPGAGDFDPDPELTRRKNVTLISVDRPGYGRSDPVRPGHWSTVSSAADDIAAVLDGMSVERVGVVGWSAGGRVALALAARRPDLVDRVVVVGTPAPDDAVPWLDAEQRVELERLRTESAEHAHAELERHLRSLVPADPFSGEALWLLAALTSDEPALRGAGVRDRLGRMLRTSFVQGAAGLAADIAGYSLQPWGFEPEQVGASTLLLYGTRDPLAGPRHGQWWKERLPDARLELVRDGHLLVVPAWARALAHLAPGETRLSVVAGAGCEGDPDFEESAA